MDYIVPVKYKKELCAYDIMYHIIVKCYMMILYHILFLLSRVLFDVQQINQLGRENMRTLRKQCPKNMKSWMMLRLCSAKIF